MSTELEETTKLEDTTSLEETTELEDTTSLEETNKLENTTEPDETIEPEETTKPEETCNTKHEVEVKAILILKTFNGRAVLSKDITEEAVVLLMSRESLPLVVDLNQDKEAVKVLEKTSEAAKAAKLEENPGTAREASGVADVGTTAPNTAREERTPDEPAEINHPDGPAAARPGGQGDTRACTDGTLASW